MPFFRTLRSSFLAAPILAAPILGLLALPGCQSTPGDDGDYGVSAVQFQDVVVPNGMALIDKHYESHSREEAGWRYGHYEYKGTAPVSEACSYLLQRMPQHNWQLVGDDQPTENARKLRFQRGRYVADYLVERAEGATRMVIDYRTEITADK